jgi:hypothetical protein
LIALVFHADKLFLGSFEPIIIHDTFTSEFQRYEAAGELLTKHGLFAWFPNMTGGLPSYAWHYSPFYILCLMSIIVPSWIIYALLVIVPMILAGRGMQRFLNERLKVTPWCAMAGGLFFMFSGQLMERTPVLIFYHVFPIFFMWFTDFFDHKTSLAQKLPKIIGLNLILLVSYPTHLLPMFPILQILMILLLYYEEKNKMKKLLVWSVVIWAGYILTWAPVLYSLFDFIPYFHRTYDKNLSFLHFFPSFLHFLKRVLSLFVTSSLYSITLPFVIAGLVSIAFSRKVRNLFMILFILLIIFAFFDVGYFHKMLLNGKIDISQFRFMIFFAIPVFSFVSLDEISLRGALKLKSGYCILPIIVTVVMLVIVLNTDNLLRKAFLVNFYALNIIGFILTICVYLYVISPQKDAVYR